MNKSRRMVAVQARALAMAGGRVAAVDPRGTGDSCGDHGSASWDGWCEDVAAAWRWLVANRTVPAVIWGARLGALLAGEVVARGLVEPAALVFWQPVATGKIWFDQFFRVLNAQQITGSGTHTSDARAARRELAEGRAIEIGGYEVSPLLAVGAERSDFAAMPVPSCPVRWAEISAEYPPKISPFCARVVEHWSSRNPSVEAFAVKGVPFWASAEIAEVTELVAATTSAILNVLGFVDGDDGGAGDG